MWLEMVFLRGYEDIPVVWRRDLFCRGTLQQYSERWGQIQWISVEFHRKIDYTESSGDRESVGGAPFHQPLMLHVFDLCQSLFSFC